MIAFLAHLGLEPLVYGLIVALGLIVVAMKMIRGAWLSVIIDCVVFYLVFRMHGGTMTGGMSAAVAALICGLLFPPMLRKVIR